MGNSPRTDAAIRKLLGEADCHPRLVRCSSCVHWQRDENRYNRAIDPEENPATGDEWASEDERKMWFPFEVRYCKHPKLLFYQRPAKDGAAVFDGSDYLAYLATGGDFGCVNGELDSSPNAELRDPQPK